jgi:hypothetical protein
MKPRAPQRGRCDEISNGDFVPQKVTELVAELERAGFVNRGGKRAVEESKS